MDTSNFKVFPWYDREKEKQMLSQAELKKRAANCNNWNAAEAAEALTRTRAVMTEVRSAAGKFYDGKISEDELQAEYEYLAERYVDAFVQSGYPSRISGGTIQTRLGARELFYDEFRRELLSEAVARNNTEGRQYATDERSRVLYYNSDYYYKSEAAIAAITKGAFAVAEVSTAECEELGHHDYAFEVPDYQSTMVVGAGDPFYNFNSAWNRTVTYRSQTVGSDEVPPKNFIWFYEMNGDKQTEKDGIMVIKSTSTWAYFRDEDGTEYFTLRHSENEDGLENVFQVCELLNLKISDQESASRVEQFLNRLQTLWRMCFAGRCTPGEINVSA